MYQRCQSIFGCKIVDPNQHLNTFKESVLFYFIIYTVYIIQYNINALFKMVCDHCKIRCLDWAWTTGRTNPQYNHRIAQCFISTYFEENSPHYTPTPSSLTEASCYSAEIPFFGVPRSRNVANSWVFCSWEFPVPFTLSLPHPLTHPKKTTSWFRGPAQSALIPHNVRAALPSAWKRAVDFSPLPLRILWKWTWSWTSAVTPGRSISASSTPRAPV